MFVRALKHGWSCFWDAYKSMRALKKTETHPSILAVYYVPEDRKAQVFVKGGTYRATRVAAKYTVEAAHKAGTWINMSCEDEGDPVIQGAYRCR